LFGIFTKLMGYKNWVFISTVPLSIAHGSMDHKGPQRLAQAPSAVITGMLER
jgi:hypothetical protein